ncbi:carbonic anhydrase, partial [Chytriomyces sp. MP71]
EPKLPEKYKSTNLNHLLERNRRWAASFQKHHPNLLNQLSQKQNPEICWIGCSDSRVPPSTILALPPGAVFVHRNIANVVYEGDASIQSVLAYAVAVLKVKHVIVCGHTCCGGCAAALGGEDMGGWLRGVRDLAATNVERLNRLKREGAARDALAEVNAVQGAKGVAQSRVVQEAWAKGQEVIVHAWMYAVEDGRIRDLGFSNHG